jgi:anti-sigma B factor antagonist
MDGAGLAWQTQPLSGAVVVQPTGRVDESTANEFGEQLNAEVRVAPALLILNLSGITYMSSRGLRMLTLAQRLGNEHGVRIALSAPNEIMREILAISRYDLVFPLFDTDEQAAAE